MCRDATRRDRTAEPNLTRRAVLTAATAVATASVAGCLGADEEAVEVPDPETVAESEVCSQCSMVVTNYPGPTGQVFYTGDVPEERNGIDAFCSFECLFTFDHEQRRVGWDPIVYYVTDYSRVDYRVDGSGRITRHRSSDAFADAETLHFVHGSDVQGAMGETPVPFSDEDDAEAFSDEHGGTIVGWSDLDGE